MKRRLISGIAVLLLLASMALPMALATETEEPTETTTEETTEETKREFSTATSGSCGKNLTWQLQDHTLIITGSGKMDAGCPWEFYKDTIHTLILNGEITTIGDEAFASCNNLQYIDFGDSLVEIGYRAFYSCNALEAIRLPDSFRKFEKESFLDCDSLQVVYCEGPMPSFRGSCLYTNHTVQVLFSAQVPWPYEETSRLVSNFGGRIHVDVGSEEALEEYLEDASFDVPQQTQPAVRETEPAPTETEPAPTVPETTPPPAVTVPATEPVPTVPATEPAPTVPATEPAPTVPETTAPVISTEPAAEPVFQLESEPLFVTEPERIPETAEKDSEGFGPIIWVIIVAAALTGILVLSLVIRMVIHSTGRYED